MRRLAVLVANVLVPLGDNSLVTPRWFEEWREDPKPQSQVPKAQSQEKNGKEKAATQEKTPPPVM